MTHPRKAHRLSLRVLVDNVVDIFLGSQGPCSCPEPGPAAALWAEQGLSLWIEAQAPGRPPVRLLHDFGRGGEVLSHNLAILGVEPAEADLWMLSHGHIDHYGGLEAVAGSSGRTRPLVTHPGAFGRRGIRKPDGSLAGPWSFLREKVEAVGVAVQADDSPRQLGPGLWCTGSIPRRSDLDVHLEQAVRWSEEGEPAPDPLEDDQALVACLEGLGLVVITGCCHAGVINTLDAAAELFADEPLYALAGGLHLNHLTPGQTEALCAELKARGLRWVLPMHCTGARAMHTMRRFLGETCLYSTVGLAWELETPAGSAVDPNCWTDRRQK
jgi:7,8-dihydropterin-6-yl-methyl-4-(beta-D-ribofuranosyl)aminobenzene 5'-phosphate synthase